MLVQDITMQPEHTYTFWLVLKDQIHDLNKQRNNPTIKTQTQEYLKHTDYDSQMYWQVLTHWQLLILSDAAKCICKFYKHERCSIIIWFKRQMFIFPIYSFIWCMSIYSRSNFCDTYDVQSCRLLTQLNLDRFRLLILYQGYFYFKGPQRVCLF